MSAAPRNACNRRTPWTIALQSLGRTPRTTVLALGLSALMLLPVATIVVLALGTRDGTWSHLAQTVLARALWQTALLLLGVGAVTCVVGTASAWIVTMFRFAGRDIVDRLLVLPLAVPTYITAYAWVELLDYSGPVQRGLRSAFGWGRPADYWFPDVHSLGGAIFIIAFVLYPYVYVAARASFVQQSVCVLEVARTLGRTSFETFLAVALPMARPAIVAGVALVAMECMNDFGAVQYLGIETMTVAVYTTWLERGSLGGAAQIAVGAIAVVVALVLMERSARSDGRTHNTTGRLRAIPFADLTGWRGVMAAIACFLPVLAGFVIPVIVLASHATSYLDDLALWAFWRATANSVGLAAIAAGVTALAGLVIAFASREAGARFMTGAARLAGLGYAVPGTVLALGLLIPIAAFDNAIDAVLRAIFGISSGLLISGGLTILVIAYLARFLAVAIGAVEAGFERLSPNLDAAARTLGETAVSAMRRVHLPLLVPALGSAALLVFVDAMKELPATLLLRPLNFDTLATRVYSLARLEQFEHAALGALAIVIVGLVPVLVLHQAVAGGRAGGRDRSQM